MIARLSGLVAGIEAERCVIDVGGVGYLVQASTRTLAALPTPPVRVTLLIETTVREDAILLYGFLDPAERDWFRLLTTVQGVGAKVALAILSTLAPNALIAAIAGGDRAALTRAPGVGAKLAIRLLTELGERAGALPGEGVTLPGGQAVAPELAGVGGDALSALVNLGYRRAEAQAAVARAMAEIGEDAGLDQVIRAGLRQLAR